MPQIKTENYAILADLCRFHTPTRLVIRTSERLLGAAVRARSVRLSLLTICIIHEWKWRLFESCALAIRRGCGDTLQERMRADEQFESVIVAHMSM